MGKLFDEMEDNYSFTWESIGDINEGRSNLIKKWWVSKLNATSILNLCAFTLSNNIHLRLKTKKLL